MEEPHSSLRDCSCCKEGHVYRSQHEAFDNLARVDFRGQYDRRLHEIVHLKRPHRYRIHTEDEVRRELFNRQQLHLLQICLRYLKTMYTRANKIHRSIPHRNRKDSARYQLPNDLVDSFEAIALFLMQSEAALIAIEDEMRQWQHTPGNSLEDVNTPAIQHALEQLGELGQGAQAAMTRAPRCPECCLYTCNPDTSYLSTQPPEKY
jgi:hypothetical protein